MLNSIKRLALGLSVGELDTKRGERGSICCTRARLEIGVEMLQGGLCYRPLPVKEHNADCTCGMYTDGKYIQCKFYSTATVGFNYGNDHSKSQRILQFEPWGLNQRYPAAGNF